jgi:P pilus assembly chaperone PapD
MRFRTALRYGLLGAALSIVAAPASAFGIGLQPTTVEMSMEPGDRQRQVVNLGNVHQEKTISLTLGLADWGLDENGQIKLAPPGETITSAAEWVRFSPAFVTLKPGESEQVVVDMAAPMRIDREGDFRFALIASTLLPEERSGQSGVWKKYQIASLFYLTTGEAESKPEIKQATLVQNAEGKQEVLFDLENTGNAHARLRGEVVIKGDSGEPIVSPIANLVVLHEATRKYKVQIEGELPANPEVKVTLENIFAPQTSTGIIAMDAFEAPLVLEETALDVQPGPAEDAETTLE